MERKSASEMVDSGSITRRVKLKTIQSDIRSFPARVQQLKGQREVSTVCDRQVAA